jgi:hypothetical protein
MSCVQHDMQDPQSDNPSMTRSTSAICCRSGNDAGRVLVGLARMRDGEPALAEPVQKDIAAGLGDVEYSDPQPVEPFRPGQARPDRRTSLRSRVEQNTQLCLLAPSA